MANVETNGSEGDAYRYTKKVLQSLPNASFIESIYKEVAENRNLSSWTRAAYMDLRSTFFRDGQCKIRFAPGAARIAFGELELGTGDEELTKISSFRDMLRIISIAHCKDYNRHLVSTQGEQLTYEKMLAIYGTKATANWSAMKRKLKRMKYGPRKYKIIELDTFETAKQYADYTKPHTWCHLQYPDTFKHYQMVKSTSLDKDSDGAATNRIRLYLAVLPGFENITVDDEIYGESMLGIDIGPGGRLIHVNNRWNHAHDNIDERKGDNKYSEVELSMLLGGPFFEVCPPYTPKDERKILKDMVKDIVANNESLLKRRLKVAKLADKAFGKVGLRTKKFVDKRDQSTYHLRKFGKSLWTTEPLKYVPEGYDVVKLPANVLDLLPKEEFDVPVKIISIVHTEDGAKMVWKRCDDPALECYRNEAVRYDILRQKDDFIKHFDVHGTKAMMLPCSHNRMIVRNKVLNFAENVLHSPKDIKSNYSLDALKLVYNVYVPLVEVNGKVFSLHPGYNFVVEKMANGVPFPDPPEDGDMANCGQTEVLGVDEVSDGMGTYNDSSTNTGYYRTVFNSFTRGQSATEYWRRMIVRERFVNDAIFGNISREMALAYFTADDISNVLATLGKFIQRTSNKLVNTFESNQWVIEDNHRSYVDNDDLERPVAVNETYNLSIDDTVVQELTAMQGAEARDVFYTAMLSAGETEFRRAKQIGQFLYRGYTENSRNMKPEFGLLYLDINALSDIISNDLQLPYNMQSGFISAVDICNSVPVGVPGISGYVYVPSFESSKTPVTEEEATLFNLGCGDELEEGKHRPIIQFDNGVMFYPRDAMSLLETDELRLPRVEDVFSFMAANGYVLNDSIEDIKKKSLMTNEEYGTLRAFAERYRNHMTERVTKPDDEVPAEKPKKKRVGGAVKIPVKLSPNYGVPTIVKSIDKAERYGEMFVLGSCMGFDKYGSDKLMNHIVDLGMADLISRLGFKKTECFSATESVRLQMHVGNAPDGADENGQSLGASHLELSAQATYNSDRDYFINLDTGKVSYMIPFMVKNEDKKAVGNS